MGDKGGSYKFFVGKPEEKNQMENPGLDGDDIKMSPKVLRWKGQDWTDLAQDEEIVLACVNTVLAFVFQK